MTNNGSLDLVIREVSQDVMPMSGAERRVIIDMDVGMVVESALHASDAKFFIVTNNSLGSDAVKYETEVLTLDIENNRGFRIHLNCLVICESGYEAKVALALSHESTPAEALKNAIKEWVSEYLS